MRYFNTEGICIPEEHYMVRLDERLAKMKSDYVDRGSYFVINRGRQYGKTTTLMALENYLQDEYTVVLMDFQEFGEEEFKSDAKFSLAFASTFLELLTEAAPQCSQDMFALLKSFVDDRENASLMTLFAHLSKLCAELKKPVVLLIDEVDSASNNQVFIRFLSILRKYYLQRRKKPTFHSVILAGVYDIKNLQLKIRPDGEHQYNSPWNIAARFDMRMSFSAGQIADMLQEYEEDHHTGMNVDLLSRNIYDYTAGYPYLVSVLCKLLDEDIAKTEDFKEPGLVWSERGIERAAKRLLDMPAPLFESMTRQLYEHEDMKKLLYAMLFQGKQISYSADQPVVNKALMFGYIAEENGSIRVSNRIFEMRLYNLFLSEEEVSSVIYGLAQGNKSQFIRENRLDMDKVLEKFVDYFADIYGNDDEKFLEEQGRKIFLLYLKPIINGTGNYYIEARTRDARRTDIVVDYLGEQFVIELKIWHGNEYNERGEKQLADYLDAYHLEKGYLVSFNFNQKKEVGIKQVRVGEKTIVEAVV